LCLISEIFGNFGVRVLKEPSAAVKLTFAVIKQTWKNTVSPPDLQDDGCSFAESVL
jgi:hypothetical protein